MKAERYVGLALCRNAIVCLLVFGLPIGWAGAQERPKGLGATAKAGVDHPDHRAEGCRIIFVGFVGALDPPWDKYSGVVQLRDTLKQAQFRDVCARTYSPFVWRLARNWALKQYPAHRGEPDPTVPGPQVIVVGHSLGGWMALRFARALRKHNIPVELTVQVDSVGITDHTIPRNVKEGAIFYADDAFSFLTTKNVRLEDPSRTRLVEDVHVDHAGHLSVTRDPRIRELVIRTIEELEGMERETHEGGRRSGRDDR